LEADFLICGSERYLMSTLAVVTEWSVGILEINSEAKRAPTKAKKFEADPANRES
jgi:hypothetical protein